MNSRVGMGNDAPVNRLDVGGINNWDLINTEGDMRIGNGSYRIKLGVALGGGGAGAGGIMQSGGVGTLNLGAGNKNLIQLNGPANPVDLLNLTSGLRINGNAGTAGQLLSSNGAAANPSWVANPKAEIYNTTEEIISTASIISQLVPSPIFQDLQKTITLSSTAKVSVVFNVITTSPSCGFCGQSVMDYIIMLNGNVTNCFRYFVLNTEFMTATGKRIITLGAGTHTFAVRLHNLSGPAVSTGQLRTNYTFF